LIDSSEYDTLKLQLETDSAEQISRQEELQTLRSTLATREHGLDQLSAQLASLSSTHSSELSASATTIDQLNIELNSVNDLVAILTLAKTDLETTLAASTKEQERLGTALQSSITKVTSLEESIIAASAVNVELEGFRTTNQQMIDSSAGLQLTLSETILALIVSQSRVTALELTVAEASARKIRSFDDAEVEATRSVLAHNQQLIVELKLEITQLTSLEWGAQEAKKDAEARIIILDGDKDGLLSRIQEVMSSAIASDSEIESLREGIETAEGRVLEIEARLDIESSALRQLEDLNKELEEKTTDMGLALRRTELLEEKLQATAEALDSLRIVSEEAAFTSLQQSQNLEIELVEREDAIKEMRAAIELMDSGDDKLLELATELASAEAVATQLRIELDQANAKITSLDDIVATLRVDLDEATQLNQVSTPSPQSIVLIQRLREERDAAVDQLDFAQNEARFRHAALAERISDLIALSESERETSREAEVIASEAQRIVNEATRMELHETEELLRGVENELRISKEADEESNLKLMEFANDAEELAVEFDQLLIKSNALEVELGFKIEEIEKV
jgi:chromosome segregation ATPase